MTRVTRQPDHWSGGPYALGVIISTVFVIAALCLFWSYTSVRNSSAELKNEFIQFRDDHKAMENQIDELKGDLSELREDNKNMEKQIVELKGELIKLRNDNTNMEKQIVELKGELIKLRNDNTNMEKQIVELKGELIKLRNDNTNMEKQIVELKGELIKLRNDNTNMEKQIVELKGEQIKFRDGLNQMTSAALDMKHTTTANVQKVINIEDSVRVLGTDINDMRIKQIVSMNNYREYKDSNKNQATIIDGRFTDLTKQINKLIIDQRVHKETSMFMWSRLQKTLKELVHSDSFREEVRTDGTFWENLVNIGKNIFSMIRRLFQPCQLN